VTESIEFSEFYRILNGLKKGESEKKELLEEKMKEYKDGDNAQSYLDELGKIFLHQGLLELYKYTESNDMSVIGNLEKEEWDKLTEKNEDSLPQHLSITMIKHAKENDLSKKISDKWKVNKREINKHIRPMSRYITEGIIDVLE
tara:strand:- start:1871 stop:2302 length:432 start_codon:yes stop_codon:yes gene_type:complete